MRAGKPMRILAAFLLWSFFFLCAAPDPAWAAKNYKVSTVSVSLKEGKVDPGVIYPVEVSCSSSKYEIKEVSVSSEYEEWEVGKKVTYTIRVVSKGDYYFSKSSTKLKASNGSVLSSSTITQNLIVMKVTYIPSITLEQPVDIRFDEDDPYLAKWEKVRHAHAYDVRIYRDGKKYKTVTVTKAEVDLGNYATDGEDITFDVRAVPKNSTESKYLDSSKWTNCNDSVGSGSNSVYGEFTGDTDNYRFRSSSGSYASGWQMINGDWYYFDPDNRNRGVSSSWKMIDGKWYYFNQYCQMQTGWEKINGEYYYLWEDGSMASGWIKPSADGSWYYLDARGVMAVGWIHPVENGPWYFMGSDGRLSTGWNGAAPDNCWYYIGEDGNAAKGWLSISPGGPWYYMDPVTGAMWSDRMTPDGYYVNPDGTWYPGG